MGKTSVVFKLSAINVQAIDKSYAPKWVGGRPTDVGHYEGLATSDLEGC